MDFLFFNKLSLLTSRAVVGCLLLGFPSFANDDIPGFSAESYLELNPHLAKRYFREQSRNGLSKELHYKEGALVDSHWFRKRKAWLQALVRNSITGQEQGLPWIKGVPIGFNWKTYLDLNPDLEDRFATEQKRKRADLTNDDLNTFEWRAKRAAWYQYLVKASVCGREAGLCWIKGVPPGFNWKTYLELNPSLQDRFVYEQAKHKLAEGQGLEDDEITDPVWLGKRATWLQSQVIQTLKGKDQALPWVQGLPSNFDWRTAFYCFMPEAEDPNLAKKQESTSLEALVGNSVMFSAKELKEGTLEFQKELKQRFEEYAKMEDIDLGSSLDLAVKGKVATAFQEMLKIQWQEGIKAYMKGQDETLSPRINEDLLNMFGNIYRLAFTQFGTTYFVRPLSFFIGTAIATATTDLPLKDLNGFLETATQLIQESPTFQAKLETLVGIMHMLLSTTVFQDYGAIMEASKRFLMKSKGEDVPLVIHAFCKVSPEFHDRLIDSVNSVYSDCQIVPPFLLEWLADEFKAHRDDYDEFLKTVTNLLTEEINESDRYNVLRFASKSSHPVDYLKTVIRVITEEMNESDRFNVMSFVSKISPDHYGQLSSELYEKLRAAARGHGVYEAVGLMNHLVDQFDAHRDHYADFVEIGGEFITKKMDCYQRATIIRCVAEVSSESYDKLREVVGSLRGKMDEGEQVAFIKALASHAEKSANYPEFLSLIQDFIIQNELQNDKHTIIKLIEKIDVAVPEEFLQTLAFLLKPQMESSERKRVVGVIAHVRSANWQHFVQTIEKLEKERPLDRVKVVSVLARAGQESYEGFLEIALKSTGCRKTYLNQVNIDQLGQINPQEYPQYILTMERIAQLGKISESIVIPTAVLCVALAHHEEFVETVTELLGVVGKDNRVARVALGVSRVKPENYLTVKAHAMLFTRDFQDGVLKSEFICQFVGVDPLAYNAFSKNLKLLLSDVQDQGSRSQIMTSFALFASYVPNGHLVWLNEFCESMIALFEDLSDTERAKVINNSKWISPGQKCQLLKERALEETKGLTGEHKVERIIEVVDRIRAE